MKISHRKKKKVKDLFVNLLILLIIIILITFLFEIFLRVFYPTYSNFNTEMWRYSIDIKKLSNLPNVSHEHQANKERRPP